MVKLDVTRFDARARELGLTRPARTGGTGTDNVVSNSAVAEHLGVSQSSVSRARRGRSIGVHFLACAVQHFHMTYGELISK